MSKKTVIVTGAGSGIGEATAKAFAKKRFNVVLNGRTLDKLEKVADEIGDQAFIAQGDVSKQSDVDQIISSTINKFGQIDVLVNNAGVASMETFQETTDDVWNKMISINAGGVFKMSHAAYAHLKKSKGNIVNVSSVSGVGGDWGLFAYNASKGAVSNLTRSMALDLAKDDIRVNAVAPSLTETEMTDGLKDDKDMMDRFKDRIAMGRGAKPEEIADVIVFLASHEARFVNGTVIPVDGGLSASNGQPRLTD